MKQENFSFSPKVIIGSFLQPAPPPYATESGYIKMTDVEVASRLEELKIFTRHTALGVEQRIEIARQQQALREAKKVTKDEASRNKEKVCCNYYYYFFFLLNSIRNNIKMFDLYQKQMLREIERTERLEQLRRDRELKHQSQIDVRYFIDLRDQANKLLIKLI